MQVSGCRSAKGESSATPVCELTLCLSTSSFSCLSLIRLRLVASSSSSTLPAPLPEISALRLRPITSSARRCCRSAGVSVQRFGPSSVLGLLEGPILEEVLKERALSLVESIAVGGMSRVSHMPTARSGGASSGAGVFSTHKPAAPCPLAGQSSTRP